MMNTQTLLPYMIFNNAVDTWWKCDEKSSRV